MLFLHISNAYYTSFPKKYSEITHRLFPLQPQNILINQDGELKLADFGLARSFGIPVRDFTNEVVTLWYRAPDVLMGHKRYSTSVDVWSIGCIFVEMHTGRALFPGSNEQDQLGLIFSKLGTPCSRVYPGIVNLPHYEPELYEAHPRPDSLKHLVPDLGEDGVDLLSRMLVFDPDKRISAEDAMKVCIPHFQYKRFDVLILILSHLSPFLPQ